MMKGFVLACVLAAAYCANEVQEDFTINHELHRIEEVVAKEGTPGGSHNPVNANYGVEKAFSQPNSPYGYRTLTPYGDLPAFIWYHFRTEFRPAEVTFRSHGVVAETPSRYQFVGTNDEHCNQYSAWTILCEDLSNKKIVYRYQTQRCEVSHFHKRRYKCLGIRILGTYLDNTAYVGLGNVRFFKHIE